MSRQIRGRLRSDNSTGFKGVTRAKRKRGGFLARVQSQENLPNGGRRVFCLYSEIFETPEDAARGYDAAVRRLFGTASPTFNFPEPGEHGLDGKRVRRHS